MQAERAIRGLRPGSPGPIAVSGSTGRIFPLRRSGRPRV